MKKTDFVDFVALCRVNVSNRSRKKARFCVFITDIGKLFFFFTCHDNHIIHVSRILFFLDYGSQKINSVDHVSRETPLRPLVEDYSLNKFADNRQDRYRSIVIWITFNIILVNRSDSGYLPIIRKNAGS